MWIYGKDTNDEFDTAVLDKQDFGTMVAPKGRAILNAFYQDREAALTTMVNTNTANSVVSTTTGGPNINDSYIDWNAGS